MTIHAYKYQGAGNDFVIIDNRNGRYDSIASEIVNKLCDRRFGIGGDGLMLLGKSDKYDFSMRYFNSDGPEGTMCGNGGRCLVAFAAKMGVQKFEFDAIDGFHKAEVLETKGNVMTVRLKMINVDKLEKYVPSTLAGDYKNSSDIVKSAPDAYFLNTGSPHYVEFVNEVSDYPVDKFGKYWRYHPDFTNGTNVNFVKITENSNAHGSIEVRTYERGVEAETYACGTGVTASALSTFMKSYKFNESKETIAGGYKVKAQGGNLKVEFNFNPVDKSFYDVYLTGPATFVFETEIDL